MIIEQIDKICICYSVFTTGCSMQDDQKKIYCVLAGQSKVIGGATQLCEQKGLNYYIKKTEK